MNLSEVSCRIGSTLSAGIGKVKWFTEEASSENCPYRANASRSQPFSGETIIVARSKECQAQRVQKRWANVLTYKHMIYIRGQLQKQKT